MPIANADLVKRLSINTGPGNSTAQPNPNDSLGGFMSTTAAADTLDGLFDAISGDENAASDIEYRCIFFYNTHATLTLTAPKVWISGQTAGGADMAIALDQTGVVASGSTTAQAERVANEGTAPTGETFSAPTSKATGLTVADIPAGSCFAVWLRRTATNSAPLASDSATIVLEGDTTA